MSAVGDLTVVVFLLVAALIVMGVGTDEQPAEGQPVASEPVAYEYIDDNESTPYDPPKVSIDEYYDHFFNVTLPEIRCKALLAEVRENAEAERRSAEARRYFERERTNAPLYTEFVDCAKKKG